MSDQLLALVLALTPVVTALGVVGLVAGNRRRRRPPPQGLPPASGAGTDTDTSRPDTRSATGTAAPPAEAPPGRAAAPPGETAVPPTVPAEAPELETPEPAAGRLVRLRGRLSRSQSSLGKGLLTLLSRDSLDEDTWEEIEDTLLTADVGVGPTQQLVERLRTRVQVLGTRTPAEVRALLREELLALVGPDSERSLATSRVKADGAQGVDGADGAAGGNARPAVVLVVGVNGTGKTTTTGKLARVLVAEGYSVVLGAADTFRAAAVDQLQTWGERVGAHTVRGAEGGDPASVAFDAVRHGAESGADVVLIDTAGRLHTKAGLMDELGKVKRVVEKHGPVDEVLLVLDATTGQNGMIQARVFSEVVKVTGIALTKLDGTAKGGIVIAVQQELGVPVKLVGLGEGADDLAPFDPEVFVDALIGD
jgi:fused signal recognition particle receptor